MITCAVCDDDATIAETLFGLIRNYSDEFDCTAYTNPLALQAAVRGGQKFGLYILDIVMPGITGIELAREIHEADGESVIIFLTSSDEYHRDAFELEALQYLDKPMDMTKLYRALDRAVRYIGKKKLEFLPIQTKNGIHNIDTNQILYVESSRHILTFHLRDESEVATLDSSLSLERLTGMLHLPPFCVPCRGFIVNMNNVECLQKFMLVMTSGDVIPIPQKQFSKVRKQYSDYVLTRYSKGDV